MMPDKPFSIGWKAIGKKTDYHAEYLRKVWRRRGLPVKFTPEGAPILWHADYDQWLKERSQEKGHP